VTGTLRGVRFDPDRLEVQGDPVPVAEQVTTAGSGAGDYALSRNGTLIYVPGAGTAGVSARSLVWVTRQGREEPIKAPPRAYFALRLSPDGTRVALDIRDQENDIWIWDMVRQTLTRLTFDQALDVFPAWTPDGRRIVFSSPRDGPNNLFQQAADGTGTVEPLVKTPNVKFPSSFTPDGRQLVIVESIPESGNDIRVVALDGKRDTVPLISTKFTENNPALSHDGRWLAYESNESGRVQIYVQPFPNVNAGTKPVWARSGRELFYLDAEDKLTVVPVQPSGSTFTAGNPSKILDTAYFAGVTQARPYDVSPDGQRFLTIKNINPASADPNATPTGIVVVQHWFEELKARVGTR
jgi:serine/threonine-protein kinase